MTLSMSLLNGIILWVSRHTNAKPSADKPVKHECDSSVKKLAPSDEIMKDDISYFKPNLEFVQEFKVFPFQENNIQEFQKLIFSIPRQDEATSLPAFQEFFKHKPQFFQETLPSIVSRALEFNELFDDPRGVKTLVAGEQVHFTEQQISCLLCNAFFCAFPGRDLHSDTYPPFSFYRLFTQAPASFILEKLKMFMAYFDDITHLGDHIISGERKCVTNLNLKQKALTTHPMLPFRVDKTKKLPDMKGDYIISSGNKFLGGAPGGVFATGKMQEPVDFATHPEMTIFLLISPVLQPNEAVMISGAAQFSDHLNFGLDLKFIGATSQKLRNETRSQFWINVDSLDFRKYPKNYQYTQESNERQLTKLNAGIQMVGSKPLATGIWGGDAFGGDSELIFIQMWLVESMCCDQGNGSNEFLWLPNAYPCNPCSHILNLPISNPTTKQIYNGLNEFLEKEPTGHSLFNFLGNYFKRESILLNP